MIFKPRNSGKLLTFLILLFFVSATTPFADDIRLPEIGDPSGSLITPAQEQRLGKAFMRSVRKSMKVISEPLMAEYIESLGKRLVSYSDYANQPFHFFLIDDPVVNAFAGPAGHIGVYTGLVLATETESELASVVAHEIAHVSQRHLARTFDEANRMSLPMAAVLLAAIIVGAGTDSGDLAAAAAAGAQAGIIQHQINFTRNNEKEADDVGIQILAAAGFDPRAMPVFFERMGRATRFYGMELPEFLRTHPVTTNRIADSRGRAETYPYRQYPEDLHYHLLRVILRERQFEDPRDAVTFFAKSLNEGRHRNEDAQRYGHVLALMRARELAKARQELNRLLKKAPHETAFILADAQLYLLANQPKPALDTLKSALKLFPGSYPLSLAYAQALLDLNMPAEATGSLQGLLPGHPDNAKLYKLLSQAAGGTGKINQAHEYLAEYHYLSGNLEPAIQQLEIALKDKEIELVRSARMSARLRQFQEELKELKRRRRTGEF